MVNLEKKGWLYSWYRFAGWNLTDYDYEYYEPRTKTDLCSFVNTLFWGTLLFVWDLMLWVAIFSLLFIAPWLTAGFTSYLYVLGIPIIAGVLIFAGVLLISKISEKEKEDGPIKKVAIAAYQGWKDRFCPILTFKDKQDV